MTQSTGKEAFGERLRRARRQKAAREDRDIEQQQIAEDLGVDPATVARWLKGGSMPQTDRQMAQIAEYFGVTPAWLRYGTGDKYPEPSIIDRSGYAGVEPGTAKRAAEEAKKTPTKRAAGGKGRR